MTNSHIAAGFPVAWYWQRGCECLVVLVGVDLWTGLAWYQEPSSWLPELLLPMD